ncbi:thioesterase family protein [Nocardia sp. 348MFTsu5.1]|uniref:acyl-CoA thioesterase n=1 Tax=Nocardia sp. 348MFTsu5.1 TaxID=1172185 RepID=UPI000368F3C2|nr:acyl-CoA thioesterase [Nocardia sp. 348MFTsu5.1]
MNDTPGPTEVSLQLRFGDMDVNRHVNNVQYARLFEEARVRSVSGWVRDGYDQVAIHLARQEIEFVTPLYYTPEPVTARVWVSRLGGSSFDFGSSLADPDGKIVALCETTVVAVDSETGKILPISEEMRAFLKSKSADPVPLRRRS